ncbi:MAG: DNA-3-methyladenine glycosylase 2 family protein [Clostridiales bacterium]|nr:DNA-3-methyladenine glycosylase 2 family protein [Clostridiales bacterium]
MPVFRFGLNEINYLKSRDRILGEAIDRIGIIEREINPDIFASLVSSIISQQISGKASETVWNKLCEKVGEVTPENIAKISEPDLQSCGMSYRKAGYIMGITEAVIRRKIHLDKLASLPDDEVISELIKLKGIGVWTAEMILIFSLGRPDVVSYKDFGIRKGMMKLYGLDKLTSDTFEQYRKLYSPYGTVASLYLWEIASKDFQNKASQIDLTIARPDRSADRWSKR